MASFCSSRDKILLYLQKYNDQQTKTTVPYGLCQKGIGDNIELSRSRVSRYLNRLIERGYVKEDVKHVVGLKRKRKVYFLTKNGMDEALEKRKNLERKKVRVSTIDGLVDTSLGEIDRYIDSDEPLLEALNLIEDGRIDLRGMEKKEDIFVGREEELTFLRQKIKTTGDIKLILIEGEAGVGKTRLMDEFSQRYMNNGMKFLQSASYYSSSEPYHAFKKAFTKFDDDTPFDDFNVGLHGEDKTIVDMEKNRTFIRIANRLRELTEDEPLLVFLDDLQWADNASLELLHYLSDEKNLKNVHLIGAYRPEDLDKGHYLREVIRRMSRQNLFHDLELKPLEWEHTKKITISLVGRKDIPGGFTKTIHNISKGNPLFTREIIEHLLEEGFIDPKVNRYPQDRDDIVIPQIVTDIIKRRTDRVDDEIFKNLQIASVVGEEIYFPVLQRLTGVDELELLDQTDELISYGLLKEGQGDYLTFSHPLILSTIYDDISNIKKKKIHVNVAETIENIFKKELHEHYSELAFHYHRGEVWNKAVRYYIESGDRAKSLYAHDDALKSYLSSLKIINHTKNDELTSQIPLLHEKIGDVYRYKGEFEDARDYFNRSLKGQDDDKTKTRLYSKLAGTYTDQGDFQRALSIIEKGMKITKKESKEHCSLLNKKGEVMMRLGDYEEAEKIFKLQKDIAVQIDDKEILAKSLHGLGSIFLNESKYDESIEYFEKALEKWVDKRQESNTLSNLGTIYIRRGEYDKAIEYLDKAYRMKKEIDDIYGISVLLNNMGVAYLYKGELEKTIKHYKESLKIKEDLGNKNGQASTLNNIGIIYKKEGRLKDALDSYEKSLTIKKDIGDKRGIAISYQNMGEIFTLQGLLDKALEYRNKSIKLKKGLNDKKGIADSYRNLGMIWFYKGDVKKGLELINKALSIGEELDDKECIVSCLNKIGEIELERGDVETAVEYLEESLELSKEIDYKRYTAKNMEELAEAYILIDEGERALEYADKMTMIADGLNSLLLKVKSTRITGKSMIADNRVEDGEGRLLDALNEFKKIGYRIEQARTEFDLSQLYKNTGRPDLHKEYLDSALSDLKDMGMDFNRYKEKDERSR